MNSSYILLDCSSSLCCQRHSSRFLPQNRRKFELKSTRSWAKSQKRWTLWRPSIQFTVSWWFMQLFLRSTESFAWRRWSSRGEWLKPNWKLWKWRNKNSFRNRAVFLNWVGGNQLPLHLKCCCVHRNAFVIRQTRVRLPAKHIEWIFKPQVLIKRFETKQ